jgi:hypothetical protein
LAAIIFGPTGNGVTASKFFFSYIGKTSRQSGLVETAELECHNVFEVDSLCPAGTTITLCEQSEPEREDRKRDRHIEREKKMIQKELIYSPEAESILESIFDYRFLPFHA